MPTSPRCLWQTRDVPVSPNSITPTFPSFGKVGIMEFGLNQPYSLSDHMNVVLTQLQSTAHFATAQLQPAGKYVIGISQVY